MDRIIDIFEMTPGCPEMAESAGLDREGVAQVLVEAERLAGDILVPLGRTADRVGCRLENGRVIAPDGYGAVYRRLGHDGWIAPDLPADLGGLGLPLPIHAAASLYFEGAATAFMMAAGASRAGAHLLASAAPDLAATWAPRLAAGDWTATICISEPDAGSDVGRIRTRAVRDGNGWRIEGSKCWISFGDHDMTDRIGHLLLARTGTPEEGTRGLSLFLVPNRARPGTPNGVTVERIEEKLGLHGSPTCVMRFDGARGHLIGEPGQGLPQLFGMIELMRLQVACQGAGIALRAAELARRYAAERRQGGPADAPAVTISDHPDVKLQLLRLEAQASILTALVMETAAALQQARSGNSEATAYAAFLLPLAKTFAAELAFEAASGTIQVLGGAGYTREWPAERYLRDARILTIYEGTTGMQAQDFLFRRLIRDRGVGLEAFVAKARSELARGEKSEQSGLVAETLNRLASLSGAVATWSKSEQQAAADGYLRAGWSTVGGFLAWRLVARGGPLANAGFYWLNRVKSRFDLVEADMSSARIVLP
jgi:alkylation response protein AidB-like acyl-CoA dehydrogenase